MRASFVLIVSLLACGDPTLPVDGGSDAPALPDAYRAPYDAGPQFTLGTADRPAPVVLPTAYDGTTRLPLILMLHGDLITGAVEDGYLHFSAAARTSGAYTVLPRGSMDADGNPTWNYFGRTGTDDVAYLTSVLDQAEAMLPVDTSRVYVFGHSSGGFMAYRMACEISGRLAAIGTLAGADFPGATDCVPARAVSVLQVHGTADALVPYAGMPGEHTGAVESTQRWAMRASCDLSMATMSAPFDLDVAVDGPETVATDYVAGCVGARVTLYTMTGSSHIPSLPMTSTQRFIDWLLMRSMPPS